MKRNVIILTFFLTFNILISLPSDDIWNKIQNYANDGKMIINKQKTYFIFDELNYIGLDINNHKMEIMYKKQEEIFNKYNVSNYIIIVKNLDEQKESIDSFISNLSKYLGNKYGVEMDKSVIAFLSIESRIIRILPGEITKKTIKIDRVESMVKKLYPYFEKEKYFNLCYEL